MPIVKNPILKALQDMVGISPEPSPTVLDTDNVSLTLPIVPNIVRRSSGLGVSDGWFTAIMENVHSAADDEDSTLDPYASGDGSVNVPSPIPPGWDVWLLGVTGQRSSGAGDLTSAVLSVNPAPHSQGYGIDDNGAVVVTSTPLHLVQFDALNTDGAFARASMTELVSGKLWVPLNLRLTRASSLRFDSRAAAAAEFQLLMIMGVFPASLGQDVVA